MQGGLLGLYIHVPFCLQKCAYCDFYSGPHAPEHMDAYLKAVTAHIREAAGFTRKYSVDTIYFGGGTPTLLGAKRLTDLLNTCRRVFNLTNNPEITIEANPGTVDPKLLKKLRKAGYNRLSIGVQSLDDNRLLELGRAHNAAQAQSAFDDARDAGFDNISVDILYGLPDQSLDEWRHTLNEIIKWKPDHISCYGLKLEEGTPLYDKRVVLNIPDDDAQADCYLAADELLTSAGFEHYEVSNFAAPSRASRHNMKYWTLQPYMGFGPSAHSDFDGRRYSIIPDLAAYIKGIADGDEVLRDSEYIPEVERAGEYLMLNLRTSYGVSSNEYTRMFRASFETIEADLARCEAHGLAVHSGDRWRLSPKGFLVSNAILARILGVPIEKQSRHLE
ncbi:coproporphyrinogen III oxidase [Clostridia bacterium]|nr:coproporphyrinogen III oxidase [Clostridia bacterium]